MTQELMGSSGGTPALVQGRGLGPRVDSLDLLRGVAILGIFLMNTQSMLLPQNAYTNPASYGDFTGRNFWAYVFTNLFADMKFITIFSFMFGAGIMLQGERVASRGMWPWAVHYKRMIVLLIFGLIHAYGVWYGDILTTYACCGILLYPLKKLPAGVLVAAGLVLVMCELPLGAVLATEAYQRVPVVRQVQEYHIKLSEGMGDEAEIAAYTGPVREEFQYRGWMSWDAQTTGFLLWTFWRCGGCILIGMGLQRWRFFHGEWGMAAYWGIALFCIATGWTMTGLGIVNNEDAQWDGTYLWRFGLDFNYVGSLLAALGYMAVGVLVAGRIGLAAEAQRGDLWTRGLSVVAMPIRAVGKTALSNYIFQSLVGTTLAYAHVMPNGMQLGLGWFGKVPRAGLLPIVLLVWAVQLALSVVWVQFFRQGPLEWAWHKLVYLGREYPMRPKEGVRE